MTHLFCFGAGFSARHFVPALRDRGIRVTGTTRSAEKLADLEAVGMTARLFTEETRFDPEMLADVTHVLSSVPPDDRGDPVLRVYGPALAARAPALAWVGYLSTTGVYGDHGGDWVDETTPPAPVSMRGKRRVAAESAWTALRKTHGLPVHVFRLAGIYGPGRNALESVRDGTARRIRKAGQVFSRIHVADIATVLAASIDRPNPGTVYNVCDDDPAAPDAVVEHAAGLLGLEPPPLQSFEDAAPDMSAMARSFYGESKRCRNDRIKDELGVTLRYPTYREGLAALRADLGN